jgi:serine/threonine protein kinase
VTSRTALQVNPGGLSEAEAATVIRCVLEFLAAAHAQDICYGDIKPANFVLRSLYPSIAHLLDPSKPKGELRVTAIDFGCCQAVSSEDCLPDSRITGTPMYMAPEILEGCAGKEVDVWAAGEGAGPVG